jgi:crotonobetainyl-CoA:carnitine CoA-transferase CaiB-like acyl-CoA transferase
MSGLLSHLKVVELSSVLAGPAVGMFFAEHGAQVVKIENKNTGGDVTRSWKLPSENPDLNVSAYFSAVNWGKEHLFLDLTDSNDRAKCLNLVSEADILITNFKRGDELKFGLSFEEVKSLNPRIIYGAISGFGPDSDRIAYDLILQAETGIMSMNGSEESGPLKMPIAYIDLFAAHQLKEGILVALQMKEKKAVRVEVSLFDSALSALANQATNWLMAKELPKRMGSRHPNIAPYGELFTTKDGATVTFGIGTDKQFAKLCEELGLKSLPDDPNFLSNAKRVKNREALASLLADAVAGRRSSELIDKLISLNVPAAKVKNISEVFENTKTVDLINEEEMSGVLTKRMRTSIFKLRS